MIVIYWYFIGIYLCYTGFGTMVLGTTKTFAQSDARGLPDQAHLCSRTGRLGKKPLPPLGLPELIRLFTVSGRSPPDIAEREIM